MHLIYSAQRRNPEMGTPTVHLRRSLRRKSVRACGIDATLITATTLTHRITGYLFRSTLVGTAKTIFFNICPGPAWKVLSGATPLTIPEGALDSYSTRRSEADPEKLLETKIFSWPLATQTTDQLYENNSAASGSRKWDLT